MSDPIAHKNVDLYAKVDDHEVVVARLDIPVYITVDYDKYRGIDTLAEATTYRAGRPEIHGIYPGDRGWREAEDATRAITQELEAHLNKTPAGDA